MEELRLTVNLTVDNNFCPNCPDLQLKLQLRIESLKDKSRILILLMLNNSK